MTYRVVGLASYPLWKLYRARRGWLRAGRTDLAALADRAIDERMARVWGAA